MELFELVKNLPTVKADRNYWFFRTRGGLYYEAFHKGGFIAFGKNKIDLESIDTAKKLGEKAAEQLKAIVSKKYPDEQRPSYVAKQILRFAYDIKKGDIIVIPSENSDELAFGEVLETPIYIELDPSDECDYFKRKPVKWFTTKNRHKLDAEMFKLISSHHTITEANAYSGIIDKEIMNFFIKGDTAHLVMGVKTKDNISAKDLFSMGLLQIELYEAFCQAENIPYDEDNIKVKLDVRSPGFIELSGTDFASIILLALLIIGLAGGGLKTKILGQKLDLKTDGIIEKINRFLIKKDEVKAKKEISARLLEKLDIEDPDDLIKLLKKLNK